MEIDVAPEVFADDGGVSNERVIIVGSSDPRAAGLALFKAARRFCAVAEDGRELSDEEADAADDDLYTPNYVSGVRLTPRGPWIHVDCKGYIEAAMRERMIAILVEELERADVSARVEVPSRDELDWEAQAIHELF